MITALVVIVGLTSDAWAQCPTARLFRSGGKNGINVDVDVSATDPGQNEIGRLWDSDNAANSNNGLSGPAYGALCPSSDWWEARGTTSNWIVDGFLTANPCLQFGCPTDKLTVVVEDYQVGFPPPGAGGGAYYIGWMVDEVPADARWYDYGRVDGFVSNTVIPMLPFPDPVITGSSRVGASVAINYNLADQGPNNHTWNNDAAAVFPTSNVISEWQLVKFTGLADPGRRRDLGWVTIQTTPYVPGGAPATFNVPCGSTATDEWVAVGIGFNGGSAGIVDSALVGRAIALECDPNLAQPDLPQTFDRKPTATQIESKPGRSGGRR